MSQTTQEVEYINHNPEFSRFYKTHQAINEEIAGLREKRFYEYGEEKKVIIKRENFWMGIKNTQAFIVDNLHYIRRYEDAKAIIKKSNQLEDDFINDLEYSKYQTKSLDGIRISSEENIKFTLKHINYVIRCFQLCYELNILLQNTLMIDIRKNKDLVFINSTQFFESLAYYRSSLADSIANYKVKNTLDLYMRVVGYYYTYRVLFLAEETSLLDAEVFQLYKIITSMESLKIIKGDVAKKQEVKIFAVEVKYCFQKIYAHTNTFLSKRNVLPKIKQKQTMDFTLI